MLEEFSGQQDSEAYSAAREGYTIFVVAGTAFLGFVAEAHESSLLQFLLLVLIWVEFYRMHLANRRARRAKGVLEH